MDSPISWGRIRWSPMISQRRKKPPSSSMIPMKPCWMVSMIWDLDGLYIYNLYTIYIQSIYNLYTIYIQCTLHCIKGSDRHWLDGKLPNCRMVPQSLPWSMAPHPGNAGHGAPIRIASCWWVPHNSVIEHRPFIDDVWWFTFHTWWCYV